MTEDGETEERSRSKPRIEVTLLLLALAFFLMEGFQSFQLIRENGNLGTIRDTQEASVQEGQRVRTLLDTLMNRSTQLADGGDEFAKAIMDDLRRQGIVYKPSAPTAPASPPPAK